MKSSNTIRHLAAGCSLLAVLLFCAGPGAAQSERALALNQVTAEVALSDSTPEAGALVTATISIDSRALTGGDNRVAAYQAKLEWNSSVVQFDNVTTAPSPWNTPTVNSANAGSGMLEWNDFVAGGVSPSRFVILNVTFRVIGAPSSATIIDLSFSGLATSTTRDLLPILVVKDAFLRVRNHAPAIDPISNVIMDAGAMLEVNVSASDTDGDGITLTPSNFPGFVSFTDNGGGQGLIRFMPSLTDLGNYLNLQVIATDDGVPALSDTVSFNLTVNQANRTPVLDEILDQTMDEGSTLNVSIIAKDEDGNNVNLVVNGLPAFGVFTNNNDGTGTINFQPGFADAGAYNLEVIATDDATPALSDTARFILTVNDVNRAPQLQPIVNQMVDEGAMLEVTLAASDPDNDSLSFSINNLPAFGSLVDHHNGTATIRFAPGFTDAGGYNLEVIVTDHAVAALTDTGAFSLTVNNVNRSPQLQPIANQVMEEGAILEVALAASDPDGDSLFFSAANLPAFGSLIDNHDGTGIIRFAPSFGDSGEYDNIIVTVTDNARPGSLSKTAAFMLKVKNVIETIVCNVAITSPDSGFATCDSTVKVCVVTEASGGVAPITSVCKINGVVVKDSCVVVPLKAGKNLIIAECVFTDAAGATCTSIDSISVYASRLASTVTITSPADSSAICASSINVSGTTAVSGGLGAVTSTCTINGNPVAVSGGVFGATVQLQPGYNFIIAECTYRDTLGCTTVSADTVVVLSDTTAPTATFDFTQLPLITGEAVDEESGIAKIEVVEARNRVVIIENFTPGDKRVRFRSERTQPQGASGFLLKLTNMAGCEILADPIYLRLDPNQGPAQFTLPPADRYLYVDNRGLERISMKINQHEVNLIAGAEGKGRDGNTYFMPAFGKRSIDLFEYLGTGNNEYVVTAFGPEDANADFLITDFKVDDTGTGVAGGHRTDGSVPTAFTLAQNYPNPFNPETRIRFEVPQGWTAPVTLRIFNVQGQLVQTLVDGFMPPGQHTVTWNARTASGQAVSTGVYFYQIRSGDFVAVRKMLLEK